MEAIQYLWWGIIDGYSNNGFTGFGQSKELKEFLAGYSIENQKLIHQFCRNIEPAGLPVLP